MPHFGKYKFRKGRFLELKIITVKMSAVILLLSALTLSGCVYAYNYDEDGNEMNKEQVEEAADNIRESIEAEIKDSIYSH